MRRKKASRGRRTMARAEALHRDLGGLQAAPQPCGAAKERRGNPKPMTNGLEKSDPAIAAVKPANKGRQRPAEQVEPRAGAEGNSGSRSRRRAQKRESLSHEADRIRQAAKRNPEERLVALCPLSLLQNYRVDRPLNSAVYPVRACARPHAPESWEFRHSLPFRGKNRRKSRNPGQV